MTGVLRDREFLRYFLSRQLSVAGSIVTLVTLPIIVYRASGSASLTALVAACEAAPYLLFGLFSGALTDRWNRKKVMVTADVLSALLVATIPLADLLWELTVPHVLAVAFLGPDDRGLLRRRGLRRAADARRPRAHRRGQLGGLGGRERGRDGDAGCRRSGAGVRAPGLAARLRRAHLRRIRGAHRRHHPAHVRRRPRTPAADRPPDRPRHPRGARLPGPALRGAHLHDHRLPPVLRRGRLRRADGGVDRPAARHRHRGVALRPGLRRLVGRRTRGLTRPALAGTSGRRGPHRPVRACRPRRWPASSSRS